MSLSEELSYGLQRAFRAVIPKPHDRIPMTPWTAFNNVLTLIPFVFMAYLARRPDTHLIRVLLFPAVAVCIIGPAFRTRWAEDRNMLNWGQCMAAEMLLAKAIDFAFTKQGMLKIGEVRPGEMKDKQPASKDLAPNPAVFPAWFSDAFELITSLRGKNFKFGQGAFFPPWPPSVSLSRTPFLKYYLRSFLLNFFLLDFLESLIKLFPGVGSPSGGTMFYPTLTPLPRFAVSTLIHLLCGTALLTGFRLFYALHALIGVGIFNSAPADWPPITHHPYAADSLHLFWARGWHQLLRRTFLVFGGFPANALIGRTGYVLGAFAASGMYHECAMYAMGRDWDWRVPAFFFAQGLGVEAESVWKRLTGRPAGGWRGRLWVWFMLFALGQINVDSWLKRGLGGSIVIPAGISPTRLYLLPAIQHILHEYLHISPK